MGLRGSSLTTGRRTSRESVSNLLSPGENEVSRQAGVQFYSGHERPHWLVGGGARGGEEFILSSASVGRG
ncbi:hypothetical protein HNY73_019615 [Argiope bruennichi]|uniref:Uncharacterized protein n=1 Tax=Argiope bruennichi TaxID=94029 RepID=A0A8T0E5M0_ARGBR|nr:hypothetical protein HNY73_019615 [Argiope bruennichi]